MSKMSKGLRNQMMDTGSFKSIMDGGFLHIYGGSAPANVEDALGGATPLVTITVDGDGVTGLNFDTAAADGIIGKAPAETWQGTIAADGTATWFRFVAAADDGAQSDTQPRIQGTVATAGADLNLADVALVNGNTQVINSFNVVLPTYT